MALPVVWSVGEGEGHLMAKPTKALRKLSRERPADDDLFRLLEKVTKADFPDASVAMLGMALLDHGLRDLLLHSLPNLKSPDHISAMFDTEGAPMGSVAAKIRLSHALGLLTDDEAEDLHTLRDIRNTFGHAAREVTFDTPEIATAIDALRAWKADTPIDPADEMTRKEMFAGVIYMFRFKLAISEVDWTKVRDEAMAFFKRLREALDDFGEITEVKDPKRFELNPPDAG